MASTPVALVDAIDEQQVPQHETPINNQQYAEIIRYLDEIKSTLVSAPSDTNKSTVNSMLQKIEKYVDGINAERDTQKWLKQSYLYRLSAYLINDVDTKEGNIKITGYGKYSIIIRVLGYFVRWIGKIIEVVYYIISIMISPCTFLLKKLAGIFGLIYDIIGKVPVIGWIVQAVICFCIFLHVFKFVWPLIPGDYQAHLKFYGYVIYEILYESFWLMLSTASTLLSPLVDNPVMSAMYTSFGLVWDAFKKLQYYTDLSNIWSLVSFNPSTDYVNVNSTLSSWSNFSFPCLIWCATANASISNSTAKPSWAWYPTPSNSSSPASASPSWAWYPTPQVSPIVTQQDVVSKNTDSSVSTQADVGEQENNNNNENDKEKEL